MANTQERARLELLSERSRDLHSGQPVFKGTRVPISGLTEFLKHGRTTEEFLLAFPTVESWQVEIFLDLSPDDLLALSRQARLVQAGKRLQERPNGV